MWNLCTGFPQAIRQLFTLRCGKSMVNGSRRCEHGLDVGDGFVAIRRCDGGLAFEKADSDAEGTKGPTSTYFLFRHFRDLLGCDKPVMPTGSLGPSDGASICQRPISIENRMGSAIGCRQTADWQFCAFRCHDTRPAARLRPGSGLQQRVFRESRGSRRRRHVRPRRGHRSDRVSIRQPPLRPGAPGGL
jgi:hypothetical protein